VRDDFCRVGVRRFPGPVGGQTRTQRNDVKYKSKRAAITADIADPFVRRRVETDGALLDPLDTAIRRLEAEIEEAAQGHYPTELAVLQSTPGVGAVLASREPTGPAITTTPRCQGTAIGLWRTVRGPRRRAAAAWGLACSLPLGFWAGLSIYTLRLMAAGQSFPKNIFSDIASMAGATVMEGQVWRAYPHRLESQRLVMFYDDRVTDPHKDLEAMDRHVADLEAAVGKPLRAKIHWGRGGVFGLQKMAIRGLSLGSSRSPANWETADHPDRSSLDRHELAHGVVHQLQPPGADPPTLLIEGWAEAHSGGAPQKRAEWAIESRALWRERTGAGGAASYLGELTGATWYHRVDGLVAAAAGAEAVQLAAGEPLDRLAHGLAFLEPECHEVAPTWVRGAGPVRPVGRKRRPPFVVRARLAPGSLRAAAGVLVPRTTPSLCASSNS
jgi:hypothetical protein